jgi:hypothetical protein
MKPCTGRLRLWRRVLFFRADERPDFIALNALGADGPDRLVLKFRARLAEFDQQLDDGVLRRAGHADRRADAAPLAKRPDDG